MISNDFEAFGSATKMERQRDRGRQRETERWVRETNTRLRVMIPFETKSFELSSEDSVLACVVGEHQRVKIVLLAITLLMLEWLDRRLPFESDVYKKGGVEGWMVHTKVIPFLVEVSP